jgi:hypothetical protein
MSKRITTSCLASLLAVSASFAAPTGPWPDFGPPKPALSDSGVIVAAAGMMIAFAVLIWLRGRRVRGLSV